MNRVARELDREVRRMGFVLVREKNHRVYRLGGDGPFLTLAKTPSDNRTAKNDLARARRILKAAA